jgi:hypothetical protein
MGTSIQVLRKWYPQAVLERAGTRGKLSMEAGRLGEGTDLEILPLSMSRPKPPRSILY